MDTQNNDPSGDLTFDIQQIQRLLDGASFALHHAVELFESEHDLQADDCSNIALAMQMVERVSQRLDVRLG